MRAGMQLISHGYDWKPCSRLHCMWHNTASVGGGVQVERLLEEYYALEREDTAGGVPTRFRYARVAPLHDGLDIAEILMLPDKDLNGILGMGKLAAYHEGTHRIRPNYKALAAARQQLRASDAWAARPPRLRRHAVKPQAHKRKRKLDDATAAVFAEAAQAAADPASAKRKRPGPALRRAQKAAAAASADTNASNAAAHRDSQPATAGHEPANLLAAVTTDTGTTARKPRVLALSSGELQRRRMESYDKLTLPGSGHDKAHKDGTGLARAKRRAPAPVKPTTQAVHQNADAGPEDVPACLPRSAKKNKKRALKRQAQRTCQE